MVELLTVSGDLGPLMADSSELALSWRSGGSLGRRLRMLEETHPPCKATCCSLSPGNSYLANCRPLEKKNVMPLMRSVSSDFDFEEQIKPPNYSMYGDGGLTALDMTAPAGDMAGWLEGLPWDENDSGEMLLCSILAEAAMRDWRPLELPACLAMMETIGFIPYQL